MGGWCSIPSSFSAELMGDLGFDWICIDTQHGIIGYEQMVGMLQGLSITGTPAIVRVSENSSGEIMKALDAGATGVIVPMVNSPDEAKAAVGACRYPTAGYRSWGPTRAALHVPDFNPAAANRAVICTVMIETVEAVKGLEEILDVPGIDAVFIGPNDLAVSNGLEPDFTARNPAHRQQIETILESCKRHQIVAGIFCGNAAMGIQWRDAGFQMLALQTDAMLMRTGAQELLAQIRDPKLRVPTAETRSSYA
jgi:4-hydroxy-2-oxoheptanedioate aldolase